MIVVNVLHIGVKCQTRNHYKSHQMALWNDLIPRLHRPRVLADDRPTFPAPTTTTDQQQQSSSPSSTAAETSTSTLAAMGRDGGRLATAMSAVGQDRKSQDQKSHDLQHYTDVISDDAGESSNGNDVTVSFSLALIVGCILLLLNVIVFVGTMCQWPRLRRRRRRNRKQRHAAALAALTSHPVDNRKSDGDITSPLRSGEVTEDTRLTLLCPDDHDHISGVRACDSHSTRHDEGASNFCDRHSLSNVNVEIGTSLTTDGATQCNHVYQRNQFTAV